MMAALKYTVTITLKTECRPFYFGRWRQPNALWRLIWPFCDWRFTGTNEGKQP